MNCETAKSIFYTHGVHRHEQLQLQANLKAGWWLCAAARVITAFGAAKPHGAHVFANKRANHMKILLCVGFAAWLLARRLHQVRFIWSTLRSGDPAALDDLQLQALASGWPWQYRARNSAINRQSLLHQKPLRDGQPE